MKKILVVMFIALLSGCGSSGPMQSFYGPIATPQYIDIVKNGLLEDSEEVKLVGEASSSKDQRVSGGAIIVTDTRILFATWNRKTLKYDPLASIPFIDIESYGSNPSLSVPLALVGWSFHITTEHATYEFASKQMDSLYYFIRKSNPNAVLVDG
ncbi:PH domain-containing protein [Vibrio ulleungensis]|uniref:Uncharacterized protein n=1 Tax=Vibrio ulleungensis TaxID=2807619 RepID=A0ABS2HL45_9VIBR|nr:hypothetical protein [Vibrio ulleungensis]MBM7036779.1 hypothetical protein [Vibrio ulleungensis]